MLKYGFQAILSFGMLMLIAFSACTFQAARNEYILNQPLEEIKITIKKLPEPGSFNWELETQCSHLREVFGELQAYVDCHTNVERTFRTDI